MTDQLEDPETLVGSLARAAVECMLGQREPDQLSPWLDPAVLERLNDLHVAVARRNRYVYGSTPSTAVSLGSVRVDQSVDGIAECSVVVHTAHRPRALAMKLEGSDGRWLVTVLRLL